MLRYLVRYDGRERQFSNLAKAREFARLHNGIILDLLSTYGTGMSHRIVTL